MKKSQARLVAGAAAGMLALSAAGAHAAATQSIIYTLQDKSQWATWLVDWNTKKHTAHVVDSIGTGDGSFTDDGTQRVITLATPISYTTTQYDCNFVNEFDQRVDVTQIVIRPTTGTAKRGASQVVEIGTTTDLGGCTPGLVTPFGSPTDPGLATNHLDMSVRPSLDDLAPGVQLAGMSETPANAVNDATQLVAQVATFGAGTLTFADTGDVVTTATSKGWIVADFGGFQRGYTRIARDAKTGVETWVFAPWSAGGPAIVQSTMMVKPNAAAGFGSRNTAAHDWESGMFMDSDILVYMDLYRDATGQFVRRPTDGSGDFAQDVTWALQGANLVIQRPVNATRTWRPIANYGKNHFVLESEVALDPTCQCTVNRILPRVNYYIDEGKSAPPAAAAAQQADTISDQNHSRPPHPGTSAPH
jgi:hypothetical protein